MSEKPLIDHPENIQLNEFSEIQQILGHPPGWMLRWGISMIFVAIMILFLMAWFITYPDVIAAPAEITTENPPALVNSDISGNIATVLVKEGQTVKKGELLIVLEHEANLDAVTRLEQLLAPIQPENLSISTLAKLTLPKELELGREMQAIYARLNFQLNNLQFYLDQESAKKRIYALRKQKENLSNLNASLNAKISNMEKELELAKKNRDRSKILFESNAESELNVEIEEAKYLGVQRGLENVKAEIIRNDLAVNQINTEIVNLQQTDGNAKNKIFIDAQKEIELLKGAITVWQHNYLLRSPIDGKITMPEQLSPRQFIKAGESIIAVVPTKGAGAVIAKANLSATGMGKVEEEMKVHLRLNGYPYKEFGMVKGKVQTIADVPNVNPDGSKAYTIFITLPEGLKTTYEHKKPLAFRQGMTGIADIITEDRSFLERIFDQILSILKNR